MRGPDMTLAEIRRECESPSGFWGLKIPALSLLLGWQALAPGFHILERRLIAQASG